MDTSIRSLNRKDLGSRRLFAVMLIAFAVLSSLSVYAAPANASLTTTLLANRTLLSVGGSVFFTNNTTGGNGSNVYSYSVSPSSGFTQSGNKILFAVSGLYDVTLNVSDVSGNTANSMVTINVTNLPPSGFNETGLPSGANWSVTYFDPQTRSAVAPNGISFNNTNGSATYNFTIPNVTFSGNTFAPNQSSGNLKPGNSTTIIFTHVHVIPPGSISNTTIATTTVPSGSGIQGSGGTGATSVPTTAPTTTVNPLVPVTSTSANTTSSIPTLATTSVVTTIATTTIAPQIQSPSRTSGSSQQSGAGLLSQLAYSAGIPWILAMILTLAMLFLLLHLRNQK